MGFTIRCIAFGLFAAVCLWAGCHWWPTELKLLSLSGFLVGSTILGSLVGQVIDPEEV